MRKFKKDQSTNEEEQPARRQSTLLMMVVKAYGLAALLLLVLSLLGFLSLQSVIQKTQENSAEQRFAYVKARVDNWLGGYSTLVESVAKDPELIALLQAGTVNDVIKRQQSLTESLGAVRVLLLVAGTESKRLGDYPSLSYAELDMLLETKGGYPPLLEYHNPGQGQEHFDVVRIVKRNDKVLGYVLVSFPGELLTKELGQVISGNSRIELNQKIEAGRTRSFLGLGPRVNDAMSAPMQGEVSNTQWQLTYWAAEHKWSVLGTDWRITYWLTVAEILAIMALFLAAFRRYVEHVLLTDAGLFYTFIRDRISGQWLGKDYTPQLKEFNRPMAKLRDLNLAPQPSLRRVPRNKGASVGQAGTDANVGLEKQDKSASKQPVRKDPPAPDNDYMDLIFQNKENLSLDSEIKNTDSQIPRSIFRAYDIRGVVDVTLTTQAAYEIGRAIGSEAWVRGEQAVVVARDGRLSGPKLTEELIRGLRDSGRDVIDIGRVPTPVLYFATNYLSSRSGVVVTGSHNPVDYNGFKIVLKGETLSGSAIRGLYQRVASSEYTMGEGTLTSQDITADYVARLSADVHSARPLKVVIDCGNGVAGDVAPIVMKSMGCEVIELYCDVDGHFPNHHPDPSRAENMIDLIKAVKKNKADVGLAFDGDGDRLGVVDSKGNIIWPDRFMMLFARAILEKNAGAQIIYDVKSSADLAHVIEHAGGVPLMWKSGHSFLRTKLQETGALLAGELSGHIFFNDRWYGFDDALYSAARLIEILSKESAPSVEVFAKLPAAISTPEIQIALPEGANFDFMERLQEKADFSGAELIYIDGIRAEYDGGWGLVRASNTMPCLVLRFEAESEELLSRIKMIFRDELLSIDPTLKLPI